MRRPQLLNRRFMLLLSLYLLAALLQWALLPPFEGGDEVLHFNYASWLATYGSLPDRVTAAANPVRQTSGQPPLFYAAGAALLRLTGLPVDDGTALYARSEAVKNPWYAPPDIWRRADNRNLYLHGVGDQHFAMPAAETGVRLLRLVALSFGLLGVIGAYGAARELFERESWALTATALYALTPQMTHMSAIFHNDIAATALAALILWQTLVLLRRGATPARLLIIGLLLALGGLAKINTLLVAPGVGLALLIEWHGQPRRSIGRLIGSGLLVGLPLVVLFGPWLAYGALSTGDPLGMGTHLRPGYYHETPLALPALLPLLPEVYLGYWGKLASAVYLHPVTYTLLASVVVLALIGYLQGWRHIRWTRLRVGQTLVLLAVAVTTAAGLIHWLRTIHFITGRLLYPAHIPFAAFVTGGLLLLVRDRERRVIQRYAMGVLAAAAVIAAPASLLTAYAPPGMRTPLPPLQGPVIDFDETIRLLGYSWDDPQIGGDLTAITLCWEVLRGTDRSAAYAVKFIRDGVQIADRTTIHGLGRFPSSLWQPGDRFCDRVDVPLLREPEPGAVYDVVTVLLDAQTGAVDWPASHDGVPLDLPVIAKAVSPAGRMIPPDDLMRADVTVPSLAMLAGYAVEGTLAAGQSVTLTQVWDVADSTDTSLSQFVHLMREDVLVDVLADGIPVDGAYPTWAWTPGERLVEALPLRLPTDLAAGHYTINTGFYRPASGERVPIMVNGTAAPNNSAPLLAFRVS